MKTSQIDLSQESATFSCGVPSQSTNSIQGTTQVGAGGIEIFTRKGDASSNRGPRNSSWQGARSTPVVGLGHEHHTGYSTNQLGEIPRMDDIWQRHQYLPPQFGRGSEVKGKLSSALHS
ncbi:hypothetical protein TNCV_2445471 [Trichonephila clavipes]|nr:hypothetical protein TNCV_2445471 [Trichonephila clavipes]